MRAVDGAMSLHGARKRRRLGDAIATQSSFAPVPLEYPLAYSGAMPSPSLFGMRRIAVSATTVLATLAFAGPVQAETPLLLSAPVDLRVEPGSPTRAESITARWTVPGGTPEDATAHWALCDDGDIAYPPGHPNGCGDDRNRVSDGRTAVTVPTPDEFAGTLWVWFEHAGREGLPTRVPVVIDRTAPGAPTNVEWVDGIVRWTEPSPPSWFVHESRVHWKLCRGWNGFDVQCATGDGPAEPFPLSLETVLIGSAPAYCVGQQWNLWLWIEDAAGNVNRDPRNAGGIGGGMTPSCVPQPKDRPATPRTRTRLAISGRLRAVGSGTKRRKRVTLTATAKPASADGVVRFAVTGKQRKRTLTRTRSVRLANGRASYALTVPKGFSRLRVEATYAGSETHAPSSRTSTVRIPAR